MNNWIGKKIEQNPQLQEFIEKSLGYLFNMLDEDDYIEGLMIDDFTNELDISVDEMWWLFAQMEYKREEVEDGEEEN